jgi:synaptojanin
MGANINNGDVRRRRRSRSALMYLYLSHSPRTLYLITSSHDEKLGRPQRALLFRAAENESQAVVEFLPKDEVEMSTLVRLSSRIVKGVLGLISIENGQ